ncbi:MAG: LuxR C-terminal-related transcriptional regulator [Polyangiaceae bacterium]
MSAILDMANGLGEDKSILTGMFAFELCLSAGLGEDDARSAFLAGLLRHLGCTAYAAGETAMAEDDIGLRSRFLRSDLTREAEVIAAIQGAGGRFAGVAELLASVRGIGSAWMAEACGAARLLASQLGLGPAVVTALDEVFERWDGQGGPRRKRGTDISAVGRTATVAHVAVMFLVSEGLDAAREILSVRGGKMLDPDMSARASSLLADLTRSNVEARLSEIDRALSRSPLTVDVTTIAETFGDFADLQTSFTTGHSRRVAEAAARAATALDLPGKERATLILAAHLHDLGQVAIPTGLWMRAAWTDADRERARLHPSFTERVLSRSPLLAAAARAAAVHHERLDGSGYRREGGASLPRTARILAAAEIFCGLQEERPHRPAMSAVEARRLLLGEARAGKIDADCADAVAGTDGAARARSAAPALGLTGREQEVLRLLAHGKTNKEVAVTLGISDRTVQHHTIHIYKKLGVDTRAGAALMAARHGIV